MNKEEVFCILSKLIKETENCEPLKQIHDYIVNWCENHTIKEGRIIYLSYYEHLLNKKGFEMNKEEQLKEIQELRDRLQKLEKELNKPEIYGRKRADTGDHYYCLCPNGDISNFIDGREYYDSNVFKIGNYYSTKEEAELALEVKIIETELSDLALELNKGEKIDWENNNKKYSLYFGTLTKNIQVDDYSKVQKAQPYCLHESFKDIAIERIGKDRLIKYLTYQR